MTHSPVARALAGGLIGSLTLLLAIAAALGVLNTTVLQTRERVHDLGVFKALGMTPRQAIALIVCSAAATGLAAGVIAVPAGIALHHYVLPQIAAAVATALPASFLNVYGGLEITGLALAGQLIAVAGALLPASWAARISTASALRTEWGLVLHGVPGDAAPGRSVESTRRRLGTWWSPQSSKLVSAAP